jgi:YfiH family protein
VIREIALDNRLPEAGAGFVWDDIGGDRPSPVLRPLCDGVSAAFTTRLGGVSIGPFTELNISFRVGDDESSVRANREIAGRAIGRAGVWSVVRQVHGPDVVAAAAPGELPDADGLWTQDPERTIAVAGADCVPVLAVAPGRVCVAHAGWRGLVAGVVERAVEAAGPRCSVFAGPAIGPCCYSVGAEVAASFADRFDAAVTDDGRHVDLWAAAASAAQRAGARSVSAARICTSCHDELFFSHRRDAGRTGRQALVARVVE